MRQRDEDGGDEQDECRRRCDGDGDGARRGDGGELQRRRVVERHRLVAVCHVTARDALLESTGIHVRCVCVCARARAHACVETKGFALFDN